jgi:SAM-dependent methyltransferase
MIVTWSRGNAEGNMSEAILTDLAGLVARHPWWHARVKLALAVLRRMSVLPPARVLDVGCGWGLNLAALERAGYRAAGLDVSRRALEKLDRPGRELIEADLTQPLPQTAEPSDAVLALDVIEHLDDDRAAVGDLARLTKAGGVAIVSVPALPELFSEFDLVQGHRRRYLPETLRDAFAGTGLAIERLLWWGSWMVPLLKRQRGRKRAAAGESAAETYRRYLALPPWPASVFLRLAFAMEERRTLSNIPQIGTTLFALARRVG